MQRNRRKINNFRQKLMSRFLSLTILANSSYKTIPSVSGLLHACQMQRKSRKFNAINTTLEKVQANLLKPIEADLPNLLLTLNS